MELSFAVKASLCFTEIRNLSLLGGCLLLSQNWEKSLQETRGAGSPCRQGKDTSSTTALPAHIKSKQQESESIAIPASAAASGATLMSGLLEAVSQQD